MKQSYNTDIWIKPAIFVRLEKKHCQDIMQTQTENIITMLS